MDDLRAHDRRRLVREILAPGRLVVSLGIALALWVVFVQAQGEPGRAIMGWAFLALGHLALAMQATERDKWSHPRMKSLWAGCEDRMARFEEVVRRARRDRSTADLTEMPVTIRRVSRSLYEALRRADIVTTEVEATERGMIGRPPVWNAMTNDAQSRELYGLADRNIAEYRGHFAAVMAGVQRAEAQSAVFMTTLDSLRMKMIGHRLVGRSPEVGTHDFLEALAEARTQLEAIDTALDELDLGHYPQTIAVPVNATPPPIPDDVQRRLGG